MLDEIPVPAAAQNVAAVEPKETEVQRALSALANLAGTREVEIDLPILRTKVYVQPVNGSEELRLRTMKASGAAFIKSFNKVIFEHCRFEGVKFEGLEDFQDNLTPPDKALLVYALLDATFSKLPEKMIKCPTCGTSDTHSPEPEALLHKDTISKTWEHKEDYNEYEISSEIVPGFKVVYSMPNETSRIKILEAKENAQMREDLEEYGDVLNAMELFAVYVKRLEITEGDEVHILDNKVEQIIPTMNKMPLELQAKLLEDTTLEEFVEYTPKFYLNIHCSNLTCEKPDFKWDKVDPEQDFFLKALSVYN